MGYCLWKSLEQIKNHIINYIAHTQYTIQCISYNDTVKHIGHIYIDISNKKQ